MPMDSNQIAATIGGFQQQTMMGMQHSGMISQYAGMAGAQPGARAEGMAGGGFNRMAAIGAPAMGAGMMIAGMDPITMGARAAWGARGMGMMGMGAAGLGVGAVAAAPLMAAQWAGGQMMTGMGQQQQLNTTLRQQYRGVNQYGEMGFARGGMGDIGATMRQMAMQRGPGGEFASMDELGRLAANMGRMGLSQGVRNAKDFNEKFQQMVKTVKLVATELGTSLEQAQEVMAGMRGAGVFRQGDMAAMAQRIRAGAQAGGLATSELTGMQMVGSQISRAIGGRGIAGGAAGVELMTQIGAAQRAGVLTEEQLYNATGLSGAEGRRAFATAQMQASARFLRGGLGRRVLASMAERGGEIDESMVADYLAGNVTTGRTMQEAGRHLGRTGRASFIRHEGRLRGEALRAFGGQAHLVALRGWIQQRGMSVDDLDDRSMVWLRRRTGMDYDQLEASISMLRSQGQVQAQRETGQETDQYVRRIQAQRRTMGIEGVKRNLEEFRNKVNNQMQQVGAEVYELGSGMVERFMNRLTDNYVKNISEDIPALARDIRLRAGTATETAALERLGLGPGGGVGGGAGRFLTAQGEQRIFGGGAALGEQADRNMRIFENRDRARLRRAGYDPGVVTEMRQVQQQMQRARGIQGAFFEGVANQQIAGRYEARGEQAQDSLSRAVGAGEIRGGGEERLRTFGRWLEREGKKDNQMAQAAAWFDQTDDEGKSRIMSSMMRGAKMQSKEARYMTVPELSGVYDASRFLTAEDRAQAIGEAFTEGFGGFDPAMAGARREFVEGRAGAAGDVIGTGARIHAGAATLGLTELFGAGEDIQRFFGGRAEEGVRAGYGAEMGGISGRVVRGVGRRLESERELGLQRAIFGRNEAARTAAIETYRGRYEAAGRAIFGEGGAGDTRGEMFKRASPTQQQEWFLTRGMAAVGELEQAFQEAETPGEVDVGAIAKGYGLSEQELRHTYAASSATSSNKQKEEQRQYFETAGRHARHQMTMMRRGGVVKGGGITEAIHERFGAIGARGGGGTLGQTFVAGMARAAREREAMIGVASTEGEDREALAAAQEASRGAWGAFEQMTIAEKTQLSRALRETPGMGPMGDITARITGVERRLVRAGGTAAGGAGAFRRMRAMEGMLGLKRGTVTGRTAADYQKLDVDTMVERMVSGAQLGDVDVEKVEAFREQARQAVVSVRQGETGAAARQIEALQGSEAVREREQNKQDDAARQNDPSYRALAAIQGHLESGIRVTNLHEVNAKDGGKKDPEDTGEYGVRVKE